MQGMFKGEAAPPFCLQWFHDGMGGVEWRRNRGEAERERPEEGAGGRGEPAEDWCLAMSLLDFGELRFFGDDD